MHSVERKSSGIAFHRVDLAEKMNGAHIVQGCNGEAPATLGQQEPYSRRPVNNNNNNNNKALLPYSTCKGYMINWNVVWR